MDPDDAMDVKRGDEAIDQGLAYQLEQCRYALLQRDEQLRKALQELSEERQQSANMCNQRAELKRADMESFMRERSIPLERPGGKP